MAHQQADRATHERSRAVSAVPVGVPCASIRNARGQFSKLVCVNAHDRCFGGADGDCPYCEVKQ